MNNRFKELVLIIFNKTFGILPYHNERTGLYINLFPSYQLGRDIKKIEQNEPLSNPGIYVAAINEFYSNNQDICIEKTTQLIGLLMSNGFLNNHKGPDILSKCDKNTLSIYHNLILDIWDYYYTLYTSNIDNPIEEYSISKSILDDLIQKYTEFRLPVSLEFYEQRIDDIIQLLRANNPNKLYENLETEYVQFFKDVLAKNSFYTLSLEEQKIFFNALYAISDMLNRMHHEDSYRIDLEILSFLNTFYNDNYSNTCIDDLRRIQGCIYAISIENSDASLQGDLVLTTRNNLTKAKTKGQPISLEHKLYMCDIGLRNLLSNNTLKKLNQYFTDEDYISLYENRLSRNRDITSEEIKELVVLSLIYSNIACCSLQYIKGEINLASNYKKYVETCETYHNRSGYIRNLVVRITQKKYGEDSTQYEDALHSLAVYYHSVATRYYYTQNYADSIAIRSVLYTFYKTKGLMEKAREQLDLAPIKKYEQAASKTFSYQQATKPFYEKHKRDFAYLYTKKMFSYDEFKELVEEYQIYKKFS